MSKKSVNQATTARFQFKDYLVEECHLRQTGEPISDEMQFAIHPIGELNETNKTFNLLLKVEVNDKNQNFILNMNIRGLFIYEAEDIEEIKRFICTNSPAIMFPYIRAYVSSMSALSGLSPIIMPTLNMQPIGKELYNQFSK